MDGGRTFPGHPNFSSLGRGPWLAIPPSDDGATILVGIREGLDEWQTTRSRRRPGGFVSGQPGLAEGANSRLVPRHRICETSSVGVSSTMMMLTAYPSRLHLTVPATVAGVQLWSGRKEREQRAWKSAQRNGNGDRRVNLSGQTATQLGRIAKRIAPPR